MIYISYIYHIYIIYIYHIYILTIAEHFYTITESKGKDEDKLRTQKDIYNQLAISIKTAMLP